MGYGLKRAKCLARISGDGDPELDGVVDPGGGVRDDGPAAARNPAGICGGHWPCHMPRFKALKFGRWYICGNSSSVYGDRPHICRCWRAFSSRTIEAASDSWDARCCIIGSENSRIGERRCCSNNIASIGSLEEKSRLICGASIGGMSRTIDRQQPTRRRRLNQYFLTSTVADGRTTKRIWIMTWSIKNPPFKQTSNEKRSKGLWNNGPTESEKKTEAKIKTTRKNTPAVDRLTWKHKKTKTKIIKNSDVNAPTEPINLTNYADVQLTPNFTLNR